MTGRPRNRILQKGSRPQLPRFKAEARTWGLRCPRGLGRGRTRPCHPSFLWAGAHIIGAVRVPRRGSNDGLVLRACKSSSIRFGWVCPHREPECRRRERERRPEARPENPSGRTTSQGADQTYVDLDRRFVELENDTPEALARVQAQGFLGGHLPGWPVLLEQSRVVILAEAGGGKSSELKAQRAALMAQGHCALLVPVDELATDRSSAAYRRTPPSNIVPGRPGNPHRKALKHRGGGSSTRWTRRG
jgi:hypothetical protein